MNQKYKSFQGKLNRKKNMCGNCVGLRVTVLNDMHKLYPRGLVEKGPTLEGCRNVGMNTIQLCSVAVIGQLA